MLMSKMEQVEMGKTDLDTQARVIDDINNYYKLKLMHYHNLQINYFKQSDAIYSILNRI